MKDFHHNQKVCLLAGPANLYEQWVWENVEAGYVDEINESDCFPFAETEGLRIQMRDNVNMLDYLELYFTDQVLENIVHETNRFANLSPSTQIKLKIPILANGQM